MFQNMNKIVVLLYILDMIKLNDVLSFLCIVLLFYVRLKSYSNHGKFICTIKSTFFADELLVKVV